jgi:hypothetical protein
MHPLGISSQLSEFNLLVYLLIIRFTSSLLKLVIFFVRIKIIRKMSIINCHLHTFIQEHNTLSVMFLNDSSLSKLCENCSKFKDNFNDCTLVRSSLRLRA